MDSALGRSPNILRRSTNAQRRHDFPIVLVMRDGQLAPGLPFLRELPWIITADPASPENLSRLMDAVDGVAAPLGERWRHTAPYRGLAAMTEADSDFFFGRTSETIEVIQALAASPDRLPILLGNSGVGKSSLAQAGVMAALARQGWSEDAADADPVARRRFRTVAGGVFSRCGLAPNRLRRWSNCSCGRGSSIPKIAPAQGCNRPGRMISSMGR